MIKILIKIPDCKFFDVVYLNNVYFTYLNS